MIVHMFSMCGTSFPLFFPRCKLFFQCLCVCGCVHAISWGLCMNTCSLCVFRWFPFASVAFCCFSFAFLIFFVHCGCVFKNQLRIRSLGIRKKIGFFGHPITYAYHFQNAFFLALKMNGFFLKQPNDYLLYK